MSLQSAFKYYSINGADQEGKKKKKKKITHKGENTLPWMQKQPTKTIKPISKHPPKNPAWSPQNAFKSSKRHVQVRNWRHG